MIKARSSHDAQRLAAALVEAGHRDAEIVITADDLHWLVRQTREDAEGQALFDALDRRRDAAEWDAHVRHLDALLAQREQRAAVLALVVQQMHNECAAESA